MNAIIEWCNNNQGFVGAVLSVLTLFVSLTAIAISIYTARIPYKRNIKVEAKVLLYNSQYQPCVVVNNYGNKDIFIKLITIDTDIDSGFKDYVPLKMIPLKAGQLYVEEMPYTINQLKTWTSEKPSLSNENLYGFVQLSEGKMIKKRIGTIKDVLDTVEKLKMKGKE